MAEARLLYGVIIREAMDGNDKELMHAISKVSTFMLSRTKGDDAELEDWRKADHQLKAALG